ncbi:Hypothetical protein NCS54_00823200 [Fusarium falciforme]|uniref:Hypothetical protein n=1 Tax=Fusarium falciforme TaxID=195108 RepID=UPI0023013563|nr:Hypothetical protein NCS54_00823200 [Fusarium falciforme]WAO90793.1 Hypothetical protein NCS54_00823200 [Fusarium falciforme]
MVFLGLTGGGEDDEHGNPELYFHIKFGDGESSYTTHNPNFMKAENVLSPNPTRTLQIPGTNGWYNVTRKVGKSLELDYLTKLTPQTGQSSNYSIMFPLPL